MDAKIITSWILLVVIGVCGAQHDHSGHNHEEHRVNVTVYYESLCPDSIKFITKQLYPALQGNLSELVELNLLPYGRATQKFDVNQYEFTCRHGPQECVGNRIQACALHLTPKKDDLGYNRVATGFIYCLMDKVVRDGNNTQWPTRDCATESNVTNLHEIENCANHPHGSNYLSEYGRLTQALTPPLKSVPTIVFNNQYKEDDNVLSQTNFIGALCQYIKGEKPDECSRNSASTTQFSILTISILALILNFSQ